MSEKPSPASVKAPNYSSSLHYCMAKAGSQDDVVFDVLTEQYGSQLEKLEPEQKIMLVTTALLDLVSKPFEPIDGLSQQARKLSRDGKLELIRAVVAQLQACQAGSTD